MPFFGSRICSPGDGRRKGQIFLRLSDLTPAKKRQSELAQSYRKAVCHTVYCTESSGNGFFSLIQMPREFVEHNSKSKVIISGSNCKVWLWSISFCQRQFYKGISLNEAQNEMPGGEILLFYSHEVSKSYLGFSYFRVQIYLAHLEQ